jgi:malate dehydrogenase (oxaloacetate-decarboxylating)
MTSTVHPSAQYAVTIRLEYPHEPGWIAHIASAIAEQGGAISAIDLVQIRRGMSVRDYTIEAGTSEQAHEIVEAVKKVEGVELHFVSDKTFLMHIGGKLEIRSRVPLKNRADLAMAYTPGVARVCKAIHEKPDISYNLTIRKNMVAVVSDGSAVLGLGNIGPEAAMPVMEGKAILFKEFGGVDAFPVCVDERDPDRIIEFCRQIAPTFGAINLEDIKAPECFHIEETLRRELEIPVFHDDQHGTAVVVLAGIINALKLTGREAKGLKLVMSGAGAAGVACTKILVAFGFENVVVCDSRGAIHRGREFPDEPSKQWLAGNTNPEQETGSLKDVIAGADVFVGVSRPDVLDRSDIERMHERPMVFAMSNPDPEVHPEDVHDLVSVMATGRSDYPNQINNVLAFPGIFRGALDVRASDINEDMKLAAAHAIADVITEEELSPDYIIPSVFNRTVSQRVARAVARAARAAGLARRTPKVSQVIR